MPELSKKTEVLSLAEHAYIREESQFISYYTSRIASELGFGDLRSAVLRDTGSLIGFNANKSKAFIRSSEESLQKSIEELA